ncbi:MAG TPA: serpin family protein [Kribbellaceae bacterium]|nr:serpin family protein [Kribbellaceae bacterium]
MRGRFLAPVVVPVALVAGCGSPEPARPAEGGLMMAAGVSRVTPAAGTDVGPLVAGMTAFGHDLLGAMGEDAEGNVVISPLSIAYAFGMAEAGARAETRKQIDDVFGWGKGGPHEQINALTQRIGATDAPPPRTTVKKTADPGDPEAHQPPTVAIANGLFVQKDYPLKQAFLQILAAQYGTGARTVDFAQAPQKAADIINGWADRQTAGRITKVVDATDFDEMTRLALTNAVYLKADWAVGFDHESTKEEPFHLGTRDVSVPMMHQDSELRYAAGPGWRAVELPYAHSDLAMWVMVPGGDTTPFDLLAPDALSAVGSSLRPATVNLALPRWDVGRSAATDLIPPLRKLGMVAPFEDTLAHFEGISGEHLLIAKAVHKANITVDEDGTEAAAVTAIVMEATSARARSVTVRADRPFAFAIVHKPTGAPLFIGQVADPAQH